MAIETIGQLFVGYHTQMSESYRYGALGRTSAELSNSTLQVAHLFDMDEPLIVNARYAGNMLNSVLSSRVYALGLLMLQTVDTVTLKTFARPLRALQILEDSGVTCESTLRAIVAAALSLSISALRAAVAASSIIAPELTFGVLDLDKHLARMHFWWVALRLNVDALQYAHDPYNGMSSFEFRSDFVERCMLDYTEHAPHHPFGHFYRLYSQMLQPVGIPAILTQIDQSLEQYGVFQENAALAWIDSLPFVNRTDTALERSPFSQMFADKVVFCGNYLIQNYGYSKDSITLFMGDDVGVMNNALFLTIYELLSVQNGELQMKATGLSLDSDEVSPTIFRHEDTYKQILEKFEALSERGKTACQWHLCCNDEKMQALLLNDQSQDLDVIKEITSLVTGLRIELVERGIATSATSVLKWAFDQLI